MGGGGGLLNPVPLKEERERELAAVPPGGWGA